MFFLMGRREEKKICVVVFFHFLFQKGEASIKRRQSTHLFVGVTCSAPLSINMISVSSEYHQSNGKNYTLW